MSQLDGSNAGRLSSRRWRVAAFLALLTGGLLLIPAFASDFRSGQEVAVKEGEVVEDDLYLSGETIRIDGIVRGDVVAAGRVIEINGRVEGDLIAAGQAVVIEGTVTDDARIAGQVLKVTGSVGDDLVAAGMSLETGEQSSIGGGVWFGGLQAAIGGNIAGDLTIRGNGLELRGSVGGDVEAEVGPEAEPVPTFFWQPPVAMPSVRGGLVVADEARIEGALSYRGPSEAGIASNAVIGGETTADLVATEEEAASTGSKIWRHVRRYVALLAVGALLLWIVPGALETLRRLLRDRPFASLGWGAVGTVGTVVCGLIALLLVILLVAILGFLRLGNLGAPLLFIGLLGDASLVLALVLCLAFLAQVLVALCTGSWLFGKIGGRERAGIGGPERAGIGALALGLLVVVLLRALPVVGGLIGLLVALWGFGAVVIAVAALIRGEVPRAARARGDQEAAPA